MKTLTTQAARRLGQAGLGVSRKFTAAELARRKARLALARAKRWPQKAGTP